MFTGPLEILNWRSEMLRMSTPEKKTFGCLNLIGSLEMFKLACVAREFVDVDCCTAVPKKP